MNLIGKMPDGRPIYQDAYNRLYTVMNNSYVEIDQYGNIIQPNNGQMAGGFYNQQQQGYPNNYPNSYPNNQQQGYPIGYPNNQQVGNTGITLPQMRMRNDQTTNAVVSGKYKNRYEPDVSYEKVEKVQTINKPSKPKVLDLTDWNKGFDGLLIPLIDESREELDIVLNESNKTFKIMVKDK